MLLWHTYALAAPVELSVQVEQPPPASGTPSGHGTADATLGLTITPKAPSNTAKMIRFMFKSPNRLVINPRTITSDGNASTKSDRRPISSSERSNPEEWMYFSIADRRRRQPNAA